MKEDALHVDRDQVDGAFPAERSLVEIEHNQRLSLQGFPKRHHVLVRRHDDARSFRCQTVKPRLLANRRAIHIRKIRQLFLRGSGQMLLQSVFPRDVLGHLNDALLEILDDENGSDVSFIDAFFDQRQQIGASDEIPAVILADCIQEGLEAFLRKLGRAARTRVFGVEARWSSVGVKGIENHHVVLDDTGEKVSRGPEIFLVSLAVGDEVWGVFYGDNRKRG